MEIFVNTETNNIFKVPYPTTMVQIGAGEACISWVVQDSVNKKIYQQWLSIDSKGVSYFFEQDNVGFTNIVASRDFLAISTTDGINIFQKLGKIFLTKVNIKNAISIFFDDKQNFWFLSGQTLFKTLSNKFDYSLKKHNVKTIKVVNDLIYYIYIESGFWYLTIENSMGEIVNNIKILLEIDSGLNFTLEATDSIIFLFTQPKFHTGNTPSRIIIINLNNSNISVKEINEINHFGLKELKLVLWIENSLIVQLEYENYISLFYYNPFKDEMNRLSLDNQEVLLFSANVKRNVIYYIAIEGISDNKKRSLFKIVYSNEEFTVAKIYENVGTMVCTLTNGDCLFTVMESGRLFIKLWKFKENILNVFYQSLHNDKYNLLPIISSNSSIFNEELLDGFCKKTLVLFVPGIHKPVISGLQPNLFQEGIYRILELLNSDNVQSFLVNLPGTAGEGKIYRTSADFRKKDLFISSLQVIIDKLIEKGSKKIFLISGSSGSPLLLDFLNTTGFNIPTIFINPIFYIEKFIGINQIIKPNILNYSKIRSKILIIHAEHDEVAPWQDSEKFTKYNSQSQLYTIPSESHIFTHGISWLLCQETIYSFLNCIESNADRIDI
ncbi:hypothetical protein I5523_08145 [Acinetobacter oleivorans]|uniref:alpha/beta hydrolase family protein n=1 Tax=Acinetobacter oleivorans TaxID=1148157 RepID=UPI00190156E8|nr:hypothetical protein [Acinetobacter oleivorans]MBJ9739611.1 hypothetical protein [Acinetobacter oleivorans]MCU4411973.1 hypothetical protein [Acinetobacter oleivorans]